MKETKKTLMLQFFADDDKDDQKDDKKDDAGKTDDKKDTTEPEKKFSQEDVDRIIGDRLKNTVSLEELKSTGISLKTKDDVLNAVKKFKEIEDANKTELQKAQDEKKALEDRLAEIEKTTADKDLRFELLGLGIKKENIDKAKNLLASYQSEGVKTEDAIKKMIEEFPNLAGTTSTDKKPNITFGKDSKGNDKTADPANKTKEAWGLAK